MLILDQTDFFCHCSLKSGALGAEMLSSVERKSANNSLSRYAETLPCVCGWAPFSAFRPLEEMSWAPARIQGLGLDR